MRIIAIILSLIVSNLAYAVQYNDTRCVPQSLDTVHTHLINYAAYQSLDQGIRYYGFQMVDMTYSSPRFRTQTPQETDALVWIVLQPYRLTAAQRDVLPRFFLRCRSIWATDRSSFDHRCDMVPSPIDASNSVMQEFHYAPHPFQRNFSINNFQSRLRAERLQAQGFRMDCPVGSTLLNYSFQISPNGAEVQQVQSAILGFLAGIPLISGYVSHLFDEQNEDNFYAWYYREFYDAWANHIPGR